MCMGIDNKNKLSFTFLQNIKNVGFGRTLVLWSFVGVRVAWHPTKKKLALRRKPKNLHVKSQLSRSYSFPDLSVHTERRTWLDRLG